MSLVIFMIGQALGILFTIKEDLKVQRKYLIELGITIRGTGKTFDTWFKDTPEGLKKILDQYLK